MALLLISFLATVSIFPVVIWFIRLCTYSGHWCFDCLAFLGPTKNPASATVAKIYRIIIWISSCKELEGEIMNKFIDFGRKAMFYIRVLSGYEERRIRSYRLQLQQRLQQAQERKAELRKVPEQVILSEVRRMVDEMQALNKKLDETEAAIEEYFKPIDKEAEMIMKIQLEGEEKSMKEMMKAMQRQALVEAAEAEKTARLQNADTDQENTSSISEPTKVR